VRDHLEPEVRSRNCEESCENDGAVESQPQAFHRSLEISQTEIPTFSQLRRRRFLRHDRRLETTKTETVYTKTFTPPFDFLGYTFARCDSSKTGRAYLGTVPSKKRVNRICETIRELTGRDQALLDQEMVVAKLDRTMIGWANYFCLGPVSKAYRAVDTHACKRLRQWLRRKHSISWQVSQRFSDAILHDQLGLARLTRRTRRLPWATS
jgi:Group II intron, maturase-specific domain